MKGQLDLDIPLAGATPGLVGLLLGMEPREGETVSELARRCYFDQRESEARLVYSDVLALRESDRRYWRSHAFAYYGRHRACLKVTSVVVE